MGTVHLTHDHHQLYTRGETVNLEKRVLLTPVLLARPIFNGREIMTTPGQHVIRGALQGLMDLAGFDAAVSYRVVDHGGVPHIAIPHRTWGEITLGTPENIAVAFSHDSRYDNQAFRSLIDWLEEESPDNNLPKEGYAEFCLEWSSPEKWKHFYERRIQKRIETLRAKADALRQHARSLTAQAKVLETALG